MQKTNLKMNLSKHEQYLNNYIGEDYSLVPSPKKLNLFNLIPFILELAKIIRDIIIARSEDKSRLRQLEKEIELLQKQNEVTIKPNS